MCGGLYNFCYYTIIKPLDLRNWQSELLFRKKRRQQQFPNNSINLDMTLNGEDDHVPYSQFANEVSAFQL